MMNYEKSQSLNNGSLGQSKGYHCPQCQRPRRRHSQPLLIMLCMLTLLSITAAVGMFVQLRTERASRTIDPIFQLLDTRSKISYKTTTTLSNHWMDTLYTGRPTENTESEWDQVQLIRGMVLTPAEASLYGLPLTGLKVDRNQGTPAIATISGVQHNLHCIRVVHEALYPSHYYPNQTVAEFETMLKHAGHCLEAVRLSVQCVPDLTPQSILWEDSERTAVRVNPAAKRQCVDWDSLVAWERGRSYSKRDLLLANEVLVDDAEEKEDGKRQSQHGVPSV